jgi:hypothetical protein
MFQWWAELEKKRYGRTGQEIRLLIFQDQPIGGIAVSTYLVVDTHLQESCT